MMLQIRSIKVATFHYFQILYYYFGANMSCPDFVCFLIRSVKLTWQTVERSKEPIEICQVSLSLKIRKKHEPQVEANGGSKCEQV
ncbi:unnamed protein product [Cochlearia groenlandica]